MNFAEMMESLGRAEPSPQEDSGVSIMTREEIVRCIAITAIAAWLAGRSITARELATKSGLAEKYPTLNGASKSVGDACGHGKNGAKLWKKKKGDRGLRAVKENVIRLLPCVGDRVDELLAAVGLPNPAALTAAIEKLPSAVADG